MLTDLINALFVAGLPMFALSFVLVSWALHSDRLSGETVKELQGGIAALRKAHKDKPVEQKTDPALHYWFRFGSGFYGLVALYTWLRIEKDELVEFLVGFVDMLVNLYPSALIGLLIELFVESMLNFVAAITWPAYWLAELNNPWLSLFAAYAGYWLGIKASRQASRDQRFNELYDRATSFFRRNSSESSNKLKEPPER